MYILTEFEDELAPLPLPLEKNALPPFALLETLVSEIYKQIMRINYRVALTVFLICLRDITILLRIKYI